uniref:Tc1-like transposase DDE domain-containing protein n=1 Tax=Esox lucius TaxID=8010 RepID=A0AAY5LDI0_ESOLU
MVWGCISAHGMGECTINTQQYILVLEQHMLPSSLFQGRPCPFQQDNAKPHSARITTAWLRSERAWVLNWSACSPDLSPIENILHYDMKNTTKQTFEQTVEQLKSYKARMGKHFTLKTTANGILSSQTLTEYYLKRGHATNSNKHILSQHF